MTSQRQPLPRKDWRIIAMLGFFVLIAMTLELYWAVFSDQLVARSRTDVFACLFAIYGDGDRAYYDAVTPFTRGLETINVFITQPLNVWLIWAIVKRKAYRHALQLSIASYLVYSVSLYFWTAYLSNYPGMRYRSVYTFVIFYAPNLPWLLAYLYMSYDSIVAISRRFGGDTAGRQEQG